MELFPSTDPALLSRIHQESWRAAYVGMVPQSHLDSLQPDHWLSTFTDWFAHKPLHALVAEIDSQIVGCVLYGDPPGSQLPAHLPGWGEIISLYILPAYWRHGAGAALLHAAAEALRAEGRPGCYLWALRENTRARQFYESQGFTLTSDTVEVPLCDAILTDLRYIHPF